MFIAMLSAQAVVISLIERGIPSPFAFAPGAKLGLGNLITLIALFTLSKKDTIKVLILRLSITTFFAGTLSTLMYSLAGVLLSFIGMLAVKQLGPKRVSLIGISTIGGILHNLGQLLVFAVFAKTWTILNYLPILAMTGILAGFAVGFMGNFILERLDILNVDENWIANR
ncbi:Gx transporter family protein [Carnobacteriaceae bacterium zg-C25]|nr:Gx transporter family protein [Carnobacteriaceae bacterium zg-ZUI240]QTU83609.1 Gx transporter family protein [Carnobacteriaceae bacterium zg-C25]